MNQITIKIIVAITCAAVNINTAYAQIITQKESDFVHVMDSVTYLIRVQLPNQAGLSLALVHNDKTLLTKGYGFTSCETKEPVNEHTQFYIASATKPFTALLAAILNEKEMAPLETTLRSFFPETEWNDSIRSADITAKHLLSHTMGISNSLLTWRLAYTGEYTHKLLVSSLSDYTYPNGAGFDDFQYDNAGYNLYTLGLEERFGINWKAALNTYILDPAGMTSTITHIPDDEKESQQKRGYALPHLVDYGKENNPLAVANMQKSTATLHSAGGVLSTAHDLAIWLKLQINNGQTNDQSILSAAAIKLTHQTISDSSNKSFTFQTKASENSYTMGWHWLTFANQKILYHNGSYPGYFSITSFSPTSKLGVAINVNEHFSSTFTAQILVRFAYRWWNDASEAYAQLHREIEKALADEKIYQAQIKEDHLKRQKRKWKVDFANDHSGIYHNEERGTIEVQQEGSQLFFRHGNLTATAEPFPYKNAVRLEFVPFKAIPSQFEVEKKSGKVTGIRHNKRYFKRLE